MAHQSINDDVLKYSFALSHYITSITMLMIGLVARERGFKRKYGDLVLEATRCLNVYCRKIWVSGKMMRCVSRLSQLVQRTLADKRSDNQNEQSHTSTGRDSGVEKGESQVQQFTPVSDVQDQYQIPRTSGTSTFHRSSLSLNGDGNAPQDEGSDDFFSYNNNNNNNSNLAAATPGRQAAKASESDVASTAWMVGPSMNNQMELPSWVMSDFNFETTVENGERFGYNKPPCAPGFPTFSDEILGTFGVGNLDADRDFDGSKLGALGLSGMVGLGVGGDPGMANFCDVLQAWDGDMLE